jgi:hypothetical protein
VKTPLLLALAVLVILVGGPACDDGDQQPCGGCGTARGPKQQTFVGAVDEYRVRGAIRVLRADGGSVEAGTPGQAGFAAEDDHLDVTAIVPVRFDPPADDGGGDGDGDGDGGGGGGGDSGDARAMDGGEPLGAIHEEPRTVARISWTTPTTGTARISFDVWICPTVKTLSQVDGAAFVCRDIFGGEDAAEHFVALGSYEDATAFGHLGYVIRIDDPRASVDVTRKYEFVPGHYISECPS